MLREVKLESNALEFIKAELANGSTFASIILQDLQLASGKVTTFLPEDVDGGSITDFTDSVADDYRRMYSETHDEIRNFILRYLSKGKNNLAIFEDALSPDAEYFQKERVQFFSYGQEAYRYLTGNDLNEDKIARTITRARGYPFIAALTSHTKPVTRQVHKAMSDDDLRELAAEIDHIIIGAFDEDGFLVWTKDK